MVDSASKGVMGNKKLLTVCATWVLGEFVIDQVISYLEVIQTNGLV